MADYTNGNWHACTLGEFVALLIDSGNDPAVVFRVKDGVVNDRSSFIRFVELYSVPNGAVRDVIRTMQPESIHKILAALIEDGVVK